MAYVTPYIGLHSFFAMSSSPPYAGITMEDITRSGVAGIAFKTTGWRGEPAVVTTTTFLLTLNALDAAMKAYSGMRGQYYTVIDQFGISRHNIMVRDVVERDRFQVTSPSSSWSSVVAVLVCDWTLQDVSSFY